MIRTRRSFDSLIFLLLAMALLTAGWAIAGVQRVAQDREGESSSSGRAAALASIAAATTGCKNLQAWWTIVPRGFFVLCMLEPGEDGGLWAGTFVYLRGMSINNGSIWMRYPGEPLTVAEHVAYSLAHNDRVVQRWPAWQVELQRRMSSNVAKKTFIPNAITRYLRWLFGL